MSSVVKMKGVLRMIKNAQREMPLRLIRGVKKAGLFLQRKSQQVVPVDTGNLRNTAFTREATAFNVIVVTVGYTAAYAIYVHENLDAQHAAGKTAKFLEGPAREYRADMVHIIQEELSK
jgi:hypothetical protein